MGNHILEQRLLPWLCSQTNPTLFNFDYCAWSMRKSKESTGRVVMYKEFNIKNSFTLEATFAGTSPNAQDGQKQFNQKDFMDIGVLLANAFRSYCDVHENEENKDKVFKEIINHIKSQMPEVETDKNERAESAKNGGISVKVNIGKSLGESRNFIDELGIPDSYLDRIIEGEHDDVE